MDGIIAITDLGWYEHLARTLGPKDANFWRPSPRVVRARVGTPFLFKLRAPHNAVAGFGYFAGFSVLPDWLAWETFGEANGVESLQSLQERLARIRRGAHIGTDSRGLIGCCLIAESTLFARDDWIAQPRNWSPRTQTSARYDLSHGEGARVWMQCLERAAVTDATCRAAEQEPRYGTPTLHTPRLGQQIFRVKVLDVYGRACAVTGEHSLPVLDAAHIRPYASGGEHAVTNGLALRSDIHRLFDRGYVTVDPEDRFVVGNQLRDEFENGRSYYPLHGRPMSLPEDAAARPAATALEWHREVVFLG